MTNVLTGPWGLFTAAPQELIEIGVLIGVAVALTVMIYWNIPRWSGED